MTVAWSAERYGPNTAHHRAHDADLLGSLDLRGDEDVLDLGCGVGDLTFTLAGCVPRGTVLGVDADAGLLAAAARLRAPNLAFRQCRAQDLGTAVEPGSLDLVVSVAVLHWVPAADQLDVARAIAAALRPGGRFRADFGGHGQIAATRELLDPLAAAHGGSPTTWYFPTSEQYADVLDAAGLRVGENGWVRLVQQRRPFADVAAIRGWLASQVSIAYLPGLPPARRDDFLAAVERDVVPALRRTDGSYDQDYVRLDVLAHRPRA